MIYFEKNVEDDDVLETIQHNNLNIVFKEGRDRPTLEGDTLYVYSFYDDYTNFQKVDVCLDDTIVLIGIIQNSFGSFRYLSNYYIYDYGGWNLRFGKDLSVIHHLERVGHKIVPRKERNIINLDFGRSNKGKSTLLEIKNKIESEATVVNNNEKVRLRNWNQSQEIILSNTKTKLTVEVATDYFDKVISIMKQCGYNIVDEIEEQRMKALFDVISIDIDLKTHFKR